MIDKQTIFELARKAGCDIDGDMLCIDGKKYFVDELRGIVEEIINDQIRKCMFGESRADGVYY